MGFRDAEYYKKIADKKVHCNLCPHSCFIENGEVGKCKVRQNMGGKLKSLPYGKLYESNYRVVESNSLFHFLPGEDCLNIAAPGNTLGGKFFLKIKEFEEYPVLNQLPAQIAKQVERTNSRIICYGGEPFAYIEYIKGIIEKAKTRNIIVTNGFVNRVAMRDLAKKVDAIVFELRGGREELYEKLCDGSLDPILNAIKVAYYEDVWIEIRMTLIPGIHDDFYDVRKVVAWILNNLGANVPLHFLQFHATDETENYPSTDVEILKKSRKIALDAGMNYVYVDNVDIGELNTTFCPNCGRKAIIREQGHVEKLIKKGKCACGNFLPGVWE